MKFHWLLAGPLLWVAALASIYLLGQGAPWQEAFVRVEIEAVKAISFTGCMLAAFSFRRGDHLRLAWLLLGACSGLLLLRDLTLLPWFESLPRIELYRGLAVLLANACVVVSMARFARTARISGLSLPGTAGQRLAVLGLAAAVALLLAGPPLLAGTRQLLGGDVGGLVAFGSSLGDALSFCLMAPVLLTAVSLRGGLAGRPWWLLVTSLLAWMLYDACFELGSHVSLPETGRRLCSEAFRALAFLYEFSAGLSQRQILRRIARGA